MSAETGGRRSHLKAKTPCWWTISTTTERLCACTIRHIQEEFYESILGRCPSPTPLTKHLGVTRVALSRILNGSAGISADMALKLSDALGTSPELWIGMQTQFDLWRASQRQHKRVTRIFAGVARPRPAASRSSGGRRSRAAGRS